MNSSFSSSSFIQQLVIGASFDNKDDAKYAVMDYHVSIYKSCKSVDSNSKVLDYGCIEPNCAFRCTSRRRKDGKFYITRLVEHDCSIIKVKVDTSYIARNITPLQLKVPNLESKGVMNEMLTKGIRLGYSSAHKSLQKAKAAIEGDGVESFKLLASFLDKLKNERDAIISLKKSSINNRFLSCFLCLKPCYSAFQWCLPLIFIDACHVRSQFGGVIMMASSVDGVDEMVPLAFGLAPIENEENWKEFLSNLNDALNLSNYNNLVIVSDREKGLLAAVSSVLPLAYHSYCTFHMEKNLKARFKTNVKGLLWKAAKTLDRNVLADTLREIEEMNERAHRFIVGIPFSNWASSHFPVPRFGNTTSNIAESSNSWIGELRSKNPIEMLVIFMKKVNTLFYQRRSDYEATATCKKIYNLILPNALQGSQLQAYPLTDTVFVVYCNNNRTITKIVNLESKTCDCLQYQELGFPCVHACSAILYSKKKVEDYCIPLRTVEALRNLYEHYTLPINLEELEKDEMLPPVIPPRIGRPPKLRIRSRIEGINAGDMITCNQCGQRGHNRRTCIRRIASQRFN